MTDIIKKKIKTTCYEWVICEPMYYQCKLILHIVYICIVLIYYNNFSITVKIYNVFVLGKQISGKVYKVYEIVMPYFSMCHDIFKMVCISLTWRFQES